MNLRLAHPQPADTNSSAHQAEALVLSCMDFRLIGAVADYMDTRGLAGRYDHIILAGGAMGVMAKDHPDWDRTFWQHLSLARKLHGIKRLILIDHRDCGACKMFVGPDCADDPDGELVTHMRVMEALADDVRTREPGLEVELILMDLDGTVTSLS
ncbi:carbonic anhydrase [Aestuariibius sp. 2305UL40-4]|uniref:carbonic anhydrase n=1 Tax=Aestuariibius violaceus TaxID=3234132 RepID=UPI00345F0710